MSLVVIVEACDGQQPLVMDPDDLSEMILQRWGAETNRDPKQFVFADSNGEPLNDGISIDKLPKASPTCVKISVSERRPDVKTDNNLDSQLAAAVSAGDLYAIQELLDQGADCNTLNQDGLGPLHLAVIQNNIDVIELLLDHGASVEFPSSNFHCSLSVPSPDPSARRISSTSDNVSGAAAVHIAAFLGHVNSLRTLLDQGAQPNSVDTNGRTPLAYSAMSGKLECANLLIEHNCELESRDYMQRTPLFAAVRENHSLVTRLLLKYGAEVEVRDVNGLRPIHEAVAAAIATGDQEPLDLLLAAGAQVDVTSKDGRKPLEMVQTAGADAKLMSALKAAKDQCRSSRCNIFCFRC